MNGDLHDVVRLSGFTPLERRLVVAHRGGQEWADIILDMFYPAPHDIPLDYVQRIWSLDAAECGHYRFIDIGEELTRA